METLERARPGIEADLRPGIDDHLVAIDDGAVRFAHPLFTQAVTSLASTAELRSAHEALARDHAIAGRARPPSRTGGRRPGRDRRGGARGCRRARTTARRDARRGLALPGGEPPDAGRRPGRQRSIAPASPPSACSSTCPSTSRRTGSSRPRSIARRPGPARADALSLRAIIRYYHGRVPEAHRARASRRSTEAGDDPERRATGARAARLPRRCSSTSSGAPRWSTRACGSWRRPRSTRPSTRTRSRTSCSCAPTASSGSCGRRGRATSSAASA